MAARPSDLSNEHVHLLVVPECDIDDVGVWVETFEYAKNVRWCVLDRVDESSTMTICV
jgi:hypothetical protein